MASPHRLKFAFALAVLVIGLLEIGCQIGFEITSAYFYSEDTAEDFFKSGLWLGGFDICLAVLYFLTWYFQSSRPLHVATLLFAALIIALGVAYLALRAQWYINDPTYGDLFSDCLNMYWPQTYMFNQPPHCSAQLIKSILAPVVMALCSLKIIVVIASLIILRHAPKRKIEVMRSNF